MSADRYFVDLHPDYEGHFGVRDSAHDNEWVWIPDGDSTTPWLTTDEDEALHARDAPQRRLTRTTISTCSCASPPAGRRSTAARAPTRRSGRASTSAPPAGAPAATSSAPAPSWTACATRSTRTTTSRTCRHGLRPCSSREPVRITIEGDLAELAEAGARLGEVLTLTSVSEPYENTRPGRPGFGKFRLYVRAELPPPDSRQN